MFKKKEKRTEYPDDYCPDIDDSCIKSKCKRWIHVLGQNPQTGNPVDHFDCSINWVPVLLIETSQQVRQGAAATESMRNEVVQRQDVLNTSIRIAQSRQQAHLDDVGQSHAGFISNGGQT